MATTGGSSARTGRDGKAVFGGALVARLTKWSINATVSVTVWGDSDSEGHTNRKAARHDCTGSLVGKFDESTKIYAIAPAADEIEGVVEKMVLWETKTAKTYWVFPCAILSDYQQTVDTDSKEVIEWTMNFGADGKFWRPGQTGAPTENLPT